MDPYVKLQKWFTGTFLRFFKQVGKYFSNLLNAHGIDDIRQP
jgi:hypothetical protein